MSKILIESLQPRLFLHAGTNTSGGDVNLSSNVGFTDLLALAQNYDQGGSVWTSSDANYDGVVDFTDLLTLAQNYNGRGTLNLGNTSSSFAADWPQAWTVVSGNGFVTSSTPSVELSGKGVLQISMGVRDGLRIDRSAKRTYVSMWFARQPGTADVPSWSFSNTEIRAIQVIGSSNADFITLGGGLKPTEIFSIGGNDVITASDEAAVIHGGEGNDTINAGGGDDVVYGDGGDDQIKGGTGNDRLDGGAGKDKLDGGKGRNRLNGGAGTDFLTIRPAKDKMLRDAKDKLVELA